MKSVIEKIIDGDGVEIILSEITNRIFAHGPSDATDLELLTYIKIYQPKLFKTQEKSVLMMMGLFFKNLETQSFRDVVFDIYRKSIEEDYKGKYTPVQAKLIKSINEKRHFSFSSPTSTGKSFVFRHIVTRYKKDIAIIVPSRALINEYYITLNDMFKNTDTNILTYVDLINRKRVKRRIFVITPERSKDLFKNKDQLDIDVILFDEAQLSDDYSVRGLYYDSVIRRCVTYFPNSKLVFAYPFIDNPEVQYVKNRIEYDQEDFQKFTQRNVGQIFYSYKDTQFFHFGLEADRSGNKVKINYDPVNKVLLAGGSVLVYCSKASIYDKSIFTKFIPYMRLCPTVNDPIANELIEKFRLLIGASASNRGDYSSRMVNMLKHGIVVHHGSLPLAARYIIEEFTKKGFCRICFATSTLEQGINMPFDMVWIEKFEPGKPLNVKNLIGRAGRSTTKPIFDYGQVVIKESSRLKLRKVLNGDVRLDEVSQLDTVTETNDDYREYKEAIKSNEFSEEYNLTNKELERISSRKVQNAIESILDSLFVLEDIDIKEEIDLTATSLLYKDFETVYSSYLNRSLTSAESDILNSVVKIMMWRIIGKSFSQIVWYRYSYAARTKERKEIQEKIRHSINPDERYRLTHEERSLLARYLPMFQMIPNKKHPQLNLTHQTYAFAVDYDRVVVDTYDYLDKLIGFRLGDAFFAAFDKYREATDDPRARKMCNYIRYGTDDPKEIMLLRYGFDFEDFDWIKNIVTSIDEDEIKISSLESLSEQQKSRLEKFI